MLLKNFGDDRLDRSLENDEVLHGVKEERNVLDTIKSRKTNWIGPILRRNRLLKHVIEDKIKHRKEAKMRTT